jgi:hypothetical protein
MKIKKNLDEKNGQKCFPFFTKKTLFRKELQSLLIETSNANSLVKIKILTDEIQ